MRGLVGKKRRVTDKAVSAAREWKPLLEFAREHGWLPMDEFAQSLGMSRRMMQFIRKGYQHKKQIGQ